MFTLNSCHRLYEQCCQTSRAGFVIDMARAPAIANCEMDQLRRRDDGREDASTWVAGSGPDTDD